MNPRVGRLLVGSERNLLTHNRRGTRRNFSQWPRDTPIAKFALVKGEQPPPVPERIPPEF